MRRSYYIVDSSRPKEMLWKIVMTLIVRLISEMKGDNDEHDVKLET